MENLLDLSKKFYKKNVENITQKEDSLDAKKSKRMADIFESVDYSKTR